MNRNVQSLAKNAGRTLGRRGAHPAAGSIARIAVSAALLAVLAGCGGGDDSDPVPTPTCDDVDFLCTIMGTGDWGYGGEGAPPQNVVLYWPIDLLVDSQDRLIVMDWNNSRARRLDADGLVRTILGTGVESIEVVDGSPALQTSLHHAFSMGFDQAGEMYVAGFHAPTIIRVDANDLVWNVAGTADFGYEGDGGPAVDAMMNSPCGVAVAPSGAPIYVADTANHCIRKVDDQGVITTIAGNGTPGFAGDGGPAAAALLSSPIRVRIDEATGDLYVCDRDNHRVRRISAGGVITTVAGGNGAGFSGDGGPAAGSLLSLPQDARVGPDGRLYIADTNNHRIRRVDAAGNISTVAGSGYEGTRLDALDSGPARDVNLRGPSAIVFDDDGRLLIADTYNCVVRRVLLP